MLNKKSIVILVLTFLLCLDVTANDFTDNGDGTVTDNLTRLMWQQDGSYRTVNWEDAISYCEVISLVNHEDWRLPNYKELISIADYNVYNPEIDTTYLSGSPTTIYWTSTTSLYIDDFNYAYIVNGAGFSTHTVKILPENHYDVYVRCVRGG